MHSLLVFVKDKTTFNITSNQQIDNKNPFKNLVTWSVCLEKVKQFSMYFFFLNLDVRVLLIIE